MSADLRARARRVREGVLRLSARGGLFVGSSLGVADLLVHLYSRTLLVSPQNPADPHRDYFLLSKGHDAAALYATLAEHGFFGHERLHQFLSVSDDLYWHPNARIPGVEFHSGSLGHALAVGIGMALDARLRGGDNRVFVLLGDGELNEGSVWEACLVAAAHRLDNLVAIVDRNGFQANARTEALIPLEPLAGKFGAFGWTCRVANGHDFASLDAAFDGLPHLPERPTAVIVKTRRGKGVPSLEDRGDTWFLRPSPAEVEEFIAELRHSDVTQFPALSVGSVR
jgi:transketolase